MAIIGLTDRGAALPRLGILRKGAPKPNEKQPGADLKTHFRFECDDAAAVADFHRVYGEKPNNIRVMFYYPSAVQNFETWQEHHSAGALKHRCDGQTCVLSLQADGTYTHDRLPCPSIGLKSQNPGIDKKHLCRPVGRLKVLIPELGRFAYILVPTTSINDILELQSNLEAAEALRGDLRGIPFILSRHPRKISTPETVSDRGSADYGRATGKRRRMEKWLLSIEPAPDWVRLQLTAMEHAALPSVELKQIAAPQADVEILDTEEDDLFDEPAPPAPAEVFLTGAVRNIKAWQADGSTRLAFLLGDDLVIVANGLAETWFDLQEGEVLEVTGEWKEHPQKGMYLAPSDMRALRARVEEEALL